MRWGATLEDISNPKSGSEMRFLGRRDINLDTGAWIARPETGGGRSHLKHSEIANFDAQAGLIFTEHIPQNFENSLYQARGFSHPAVLVIDDPPHDVLLSVS